MRMFLWKTRYALNMGNKKPKNVAKLSGLFTIMYSCKSYSKMQVCYGYSIWVHIVITGKNTLIGNLCSMALNTVHCVMQFSQFTIHILSQWFKTFTNSLLFFVCCSLLRKHFVLLFIPTNINKIYFILYFLGFI